MDGASVLIVLLHIQLPWVNARAALHRRGALAFKDTTYRYTDGIETTGEVTPLSVIVGKLSASMEATMTEKKPNKNLIQRLIDVRRSVDSISKDSKNDFHRFEYASSTAVLKALREAMNAAGVLLHPTMRDTVVDIIKDQKQNDQLLTHIHWTFTWINEDEPSDRLESNWYSQGIDKNELGVGKAATYAEKFFLLKFFNIPTDKADPDATAAGDERNYQERQQAQSKSGGMSKKQGNAIWAISSKVWPDIKGEELSKKIYKEAEQLKLHPDRSNWSVKDASNLIKHLEEKIKDTLFGEELPLEGQ
jgi:hypothetical protein